MKRLSYKMLYTLWGAMFVLTAALGFVFPQAAGLGRAALVLTAAAFFLPPFVILHRAKAEAARFHVKLIRWLSLSSLVLTAVLLVLNLMSAGWSEALGTALYGALAVVSAPMICAGYYALSLFLWGTLLTDTFAKK